MLWSCPGCFPESPPLALLFFPWSKAGMLCKTTTVFSSSTYAFFVLLTFKFFLPLWWICADITDPLKCNLLVYLFHSFITCCPLNHKLQSGECLSLVAVNQHLHSTAGHCSYTEIVKLFCYVVVLISNLPMYFTSEVYRQKEGRWTVL